MKVFIILSLVCLAVPALGIDCSNCTGGCELEIQTCGTEARPCPPCADLCDKCTLIDNVGYLADPYDCRRFYQCMKDADNEWVVSEARWCADCTHWDSDLCTCSWADCSECENGHLFLFDGTSWAEYVDGDPSAGIAKEMHTTGADWIVGTFNIEGAFGPDTENVFTESGAVVKVRTVAFNNGNPDGFTTNWTLCFANCTYGSDGQLTPAASEGSQYRYIYYAENEKPENWCDEECSVIREVRDCSTPEPCPTPLVDDCPCMINLAFEDNLLDSVWNVSVIEYGNVTFADDCDDRAGVFDGSEDMLQIDFFNNYFNDNGYEFTVYFCINPVAGSASTIMENGCVGPEGNIIDATFFINWAADEVTVILFVGESECEVSVSAPAAAGSCNCFLAYWDGAVLTLQNGCDGDAITSAGTDIGDCDGGSIQNTKCALTIGAGYEGSIDDVIFCRTADPLNVDLPADCPCP